MIRNKIEVGKINIFIENTKKPIFIGQNMAGNSKRADHTDLLVNCTHRITFEGGGNWT